MARSAGVTTTSEATEFFRRQCEPVVMHHIAQANGLAVPPGLFHLIIRKEWAEISEPSSR
jgi:hypothetical protein